MQILVVEDESRMANLIKRGLEEQQYAVDLAEEGAAGKEIFLLCLFLLPYLLYLIRK